MIEPTPAERKQMFDQMVSGCRSIYHNGQQQFVIGRMKGGSKYQDKTTPAAVNAQKILDVLGLAKMKGYVVFLVGWDPVEEDSTFQLVPDAEFQKWLVESSPN